VSFHAFINEKVDMAIYETHQGGEYDATNVIQKPVVTAITPIDEDHMHQLGPSLENVAWHKVGIFKVGAPAFSAPQQNVVATVLQERAAEKGVSLEFVQVCSDLPAGALKLKPEVQLLNFSLARAVSDNFLQQRAPQGKGVLSSHDIIRSELSV
jgi:folylpolyglutamate synthase